jgi:hypothetical protein
MFNNTPYPQDTVFWLGVRGVHALVLATAWFVLRPPQTEEIAISG